MIKSRIAILTKEGNLLRYVNNQWEERPALLPNNEQLRIDDLCLTGLGNDLTHLWVMGDVSFIPDRCFAEYDPKLWRDMHIRLRDDNEELSSVSAYVAPDVSIKSGRKQINVIFADNTKWSWITRAVTAKQLYITLVYLETELGVSISGSPGVVGWKVLDTFHPEWLYDVSTIDIDACHFDKSYSDLLWQSPTLQTGATGFIHKYDRNMAFTAACVANHYGVGTPVNKRGLGYFNPNQVGVHHCKWSGAHNPLLPRPVLGGMEWIATPQVRLLKHLGYDVNILESWVYPEQHQLMSQWAKFMWNARMNFEDSPYPKYPHPVCRKLARTGVKEAANGLIGLLRYTDFADSDLEKKRPDIRTGTVSRNTELCYHNLLKVESKERVRPALAYMDAFYYILPTRNGKAGLPTMMEREGKLGGYKWEGCIEITPAIEKVLASKAAVSKKLEVLNEQGWIL